MHTLISVPTHDESLKALGQGTLSTTGSGKFSRMGRREFDKSGDPLSQGPDPYRRQIYSHVNLEDEEILTTSALKAADFPPLQGISKPTSSLSKEAPSTATPLAPEERDRIPAKTNAWTNRAFLSINRTRWKDNPYLEQVESDWGKNIPDDEVKSALEELIRINPPGELDGAKAIKWSDDDMAVTKIRLDQLRKASVVAHTPVSTPTRDEMERWLDWTAVNKLNLLVVQLRVINKQLFLLVMKNQEQRDKLLSLPDLSLDGFPVVLSPWTIDFNHKKHTVRRVATWFELPGIDPMVEHLGNMMLSVLGQPTFRTAPRG
ncbi:hypothetical protein R1sor_000497 [Riccia sorocarpa]|uniref:Uncharacterized protein n=1 Tax=Riccia sorocarpa TaxID=122646 RepID=A0ABD3GWF3_9MARC